MQYESYIFMEYIANKYIIEIYNKNYHYDYYYVNSICFLASSHYALQTYNIYIKLIPEARGREIYIRYHLRIEFITYYFRVRASHTLNIVNQIVHRIQLRSLA